MIDFKMTRLKGGMCGLAVLAAAACYTIILGAICGFKLHNAGYTDFDLAVHTQSLWNICHGSLQSSILGISFLGNHMALILFLITPIYALFSTPLTLLLIQTAVLASGAWGIFLLARHYLPEKWSAAIALLYLVYPPLIYMNLYEFHPIALATTFFVFALYYMKSDRFRLFAVMLVLAMLCQENVSLIVIMFGVLAWIDKKRGRWIWAPVAAGSLYFILFVIFIMPRLNNVIMFGAIYSHFGKTMPEAIVSMIIHPLNTLAWMFQPGKLAFVSSLLTPLGMTSLLSPLSFVPALPVLAQRLLSGRETESLILFHYQAEIIPFVFFAAIRGIGKILSFRRFQTGPMLAAVLAFSGIASFALSGLPESMPECFAPSPGTTTELSLQNRTLQSIPRNASVIATFRCLPALAARTELYSLHHVYSGCYTLSTAAYPIPQRVDYVILDASDPKTFSMTGFYTSDGYTRLQELLDGGKWEIAENLNSFLVLKNVPNGSNDFTGLIEIADPRKNAPAGLQSMTNAEICPVGYDLKREDSGNAAKLILFWQRTGTNGIDYDLDVEIKSGSSILFRGRVAPGHRIWPPQSWPVGKIILDKHRILLRKPLQDLELTSLSVGLIPLNRPPE